ncbi:MAG: hypothetical protein ACK4HM_04510 [Thermosynechococcus sp.]
MTFDLFNFILKMPPRVSLSPSGLAILFALCISRFLGGDAIHL